jgi:hypothetical protein
VNEFLGTPKKKMLAVVCGTYEHLIYGFKCLEFFETPSKPPEEPKGKRKKRIKPEEPATVTAAQQRRMVLEELFISSSHLNSVRVMNVLGNLFATGSDDETVKYVCLVFLSRHLHLSESMICVVALNWAL